MTVAAVVLAAGGGTRFSGSSHKLLASFRGRPLVTWAVDGARSAGVFDEIVVVEGAVGLGDVVGEDVVLVTNARWSEGQATSLRVAVEHARASGHEAIVVGLGDQPLVPASAWRAVAAAGSASGEGPPILVATYDGRRGNPVSLDASVWDRLSFEGDEGARELMRREPSVWGAVACEGNPADVDTVEDLDQWT